jgi:quinol-cytochrome oxidoreductase complex cytochrome b subunit
VCFSLEFGLCVDSLFLLEYMKNILYFTFLCDDLLIFLVSVWLARKFKIKAEVEEKEEKKKKKKKQKFSLIVYIKFIRVEFVVLFFFFF